MIKFALDIVLKNCNVLHYGKHGQTHFCTQESAGMSLLYIRLAEQARQHI